MKKVIDSNLLDFLNINSALFPAVLIILISSNKDHLTKCKQDIMDLSRSVVYTGRLTNKQDMIHWPQSTINTFYKDCLKQNVIPTLDLEKCTVELVGLKDAVIDSFRICLLTEDCFRFKKPKNIFSS